MAKKQKEKRDLSGYTDEQLFELFVAEIQAMFGCNRQAVLDLIAYTNEISGAVFASLNGYSSDVSDGSEVANYSVTLGFSYANMRAEDAVTLATFDINSVNVDNWNYKYIDTKGLTLDEYKAGVRASLDEALKDMVGDRKKRASNMYYFNKVLCYNFETQSLLILGQRNKKNVIVEGEFKMEGKGVKTCAKDIIAHQANLRATKYRRFKVCNLTEVKMSGDTIEIH